MAKVFFVSALERVALGIWPVPAEGGALCGVSPTTIFFPKPTDSLVTKKHAEKNQLGKLKPLSAFPHLPDASSKYDQL